MHRRCYLALVGAIIPLFSGCIETVTSGSSTNTTSNSSITTKSGANVEHTVSDEQRAFNTYKGVYIENKDNREHRIYISVKQVIVPECRNNTPPCNMPNKVKRYLSTMFVVEAGCGFGIVDVVKQVGEYQVDVEVKNGGSAEYTWHIGESASNLRIEVTESGDADIHRVAKT